jgi:hypothetical protein
MVRQGVVNAVQHFGSDDILIEKQAPEIEIQDL